MAGLAVSLPEKWSQFLKRLADGHGVDVSTVVSELCEWVFSDFDSKLEFDVWLDRAYPPKRQGEEEARDAGEEASEEEGTEGRI